MARPSVQPYSESVSEGVSKGEGHLSVESGDLSSSLALVGSTKATKALNRTQLRVSISFLT